MNELGEFFIKFSTDGLSELKDGLRDIDTKLDSLNDSFTKSTKDGNTFFGSFGGWLGKIGSLAAGILSLGKVIKDTFDIGDKIINLNLLADAAGATAEEVEALAIATQPFGGTVQSAASFYRTMNNLQTEWGRGQYSEGMREELSRAGFFVSPMASTEEYMRALGGALTSYTEAGRFGDREKLAKAFGLDDSMMLFLSGGQENVEKMLEYGRQHSVLSGRENLKEAQELRKAMNELKESWNRFLVEMMPILTDLINILRPILEALLPIAQWALKQIGGLLDTGKEIWDVITGKQTLSEFSENMQNKDNIFGDAARFGAKLGNEYADLVEVNRRNKQMRALVDKFNAGTANWGELVQLKSLMKESNIFEGKGAELIENAIISMRPTNTALNSRGITNTANNNANVNIGTINITGMGESAGVKTKDAVQRQLNNLEFQPSTLTMGAK